MWSPLGVSYGTCCRRQNVWSVLRIVSQVGAFRNSQSYPRYLWKHHGLLIKLTSQTFSHLHWYSGFAIARLNTCAASGWNNYPGCDVSIALVFDSWILGVCASDFVHQVSMVYFRTFYPGIWLFLNFPTTTWSLFFFQISFTRRGASLFFTVIMHDWRTSPKAWRLLWVIRIAMETLKKFGISHILILILSFLLWLCASLRWSEINLNWIWRMPVLIFII